ncbi:succinate dehydrogenase, hydrophobic membrane anchor protein [Erythrobacter sp.]|uniref:succinate dehydrogenase, hydrophobic membrane anchor protein n=1 Tax=Erythrobacter sp. TaxID=1042 RepID=UPI0025EE8F97|nr:succinate dehydrogenase, hydrophobic membrane anchor protein [Erythrobacter sp.]
MATTRETQQGQDRKGRSGGHVANHWIAVRLNSLALLALYTWLMTALFLLPDLSFAGVRGWLRHPLNSVLMILLIGVSFWHSKDGLMEVIDDYVHQPVARAISIAALYTFIVGGALFGIWAVARIALLSV